MADDPTKNVVEASEKERHLAGANGEPGAPEPKTREDWAKRGGTDGEAGRAASTPGGSSQGTGDRAKSDADTRAEVSTGARPQPKPGEG